MNNFVEKWGSVNLVRDRLISHCPILCLEYSFKLVNHFISGRERYICTFTLDDNIFSRHVAIKMKNKYGNEYFVVEYEGTPLKGFHPFEPQRIRLLGLKGVPSGRTLSRNTRNARVRNFISENPDFLKTEFETDNLETNYLKPLTLIYMIQSPMASIGPSSHLQSVMANLRPRLSTSFLDFTALKLQGLACYCIQR